MYSGTTFRSKSGRIMGAHQKIDRVAKRHVLRIMPAGINFPHVKQILQFEGLNGPDGVKRKSPARDEPWHYIDPEDLSEGELLTLIDDHVANLTTALTDEDEIRAAFEAAWLAHAIVDGLTPAHHYPLEEKLSELRDGDGLDTRTTFRKKVVMPGKTPRQRLKNNWEFWGAKGVMTTHFMFEMGVATTIAPLALDIAMPSQNEKILIEKQGVESYFLQALREIHHLKMYEAFHKQGWNRRLARQTREKLAPIIVKTVTLAWYYAAYKADLRRKGRE